MNLFIDTHLNEILILLFAKDKVIIEKRISSDKPSSTVIMPAIKEVLNDNTPESIIVVNGPGSFTGVRLGVTIAKTLAYTLDIPIRTISSLECMAISSNRENCIVAFNDKNGYYVGIFEDNHKLVSSYVYLTNLEFQEYSKKYEVIQNIELDYPKIISYVLTLKPENPHKVNPVYIKKLDVEK